MSLYEACAPEEGLSVLNPSKIEIGMANRRRTVLPKIHQAAEQRKKTISATSDEHRNAFAQHLTPRETAQLAVSLFDPTDKAVTCLDLGAGTGMLSVALADRYGTTVERIDCVEIDPVLAQICDCELGGVNHNLFVADALTDTPNNLYDRVILNPPYKKMAANDARQRTLPVRCANLYSAFVAIALTRLADDGELVAIIPRSWMNGDYFAAFRLWALSQWSLDAIHVYGSRTEVFEDTNVLQETMLVRFSKRCQALSIKVGQSGTKGEAASVTEYLAAELITGESKIVRIAPSTGKNKETIASNGYCPSTGKVVDFRSRDRIYMSYEDAVADARCASDVYRLVYTGNIRTGELVHPANIGKCQWYRADDKSSLQQLVQPGSYVLVKRFSSKEEARRVVAYPITITEPTALENHTSFIHQGTPRKVKPLTSVKLARGISIWLNSTYIDEWFRDMSGSTQVNAKDIKAMPCPDESALIELGKGWMPGMTQEQIDIVVKELI